MVATPEEFVSAVPVDGVIVANVASVVKVTTALGTGAPAASNTVAVTVVGADEVTEVVATPATLVSERDMPAREVAEAVDPVPVVVVVVVQAAEEAVPVPQAAVVLPPQPFNKKAIAIAADTLSTAAK
jgi:hypothetical protein